MVMRSAGSSLWPVLTFRLVAVASLIVFGESLSLFKNSLSARAATRGAAPAGLDSAEYNRFGEGFVLGASLFLGISVARMAFPASFSALAVLIKSMILLFQEEQLVSLLALPAVFK
jgi:hypothetical protein